MKELIVITGGARSGKSTYAEKLALAYHTPVYIATATGEDEEMRRRIQIHQQNRDPKFKTVECPLHIHRAAQLEQGDVYLLDCITLFLTNVMLRRESEEPYRWATQELDRLFMALEEKSAILVTNEVGMGIVPDNALSREFRDLQGRVNQYIAQKATQVYAMFCGIPVKIKG